MHTLFERYMAGQREQVWEDLRRLGNDVRRPEIIGDGAAVAREAVRRAKTNLRSIIRRLNDLDYAFTEKDSGRILRDPPKDIKERLARFERELGGPLPLVLSAWYEQIGEVSLLGAHPVLCPPAPRPSAGGMSRLTGAQLESIRTQVTPDPLVISPFDPSSLDHFRRVQDRKKRLADAEARLRDFDETLARSRSASSRFPDVFAEIEKRLAPERKKLEEAVRDVATPMAVRLELGPDDIMKFGESGDSYSVDVPCAGADCVLHTTGPEETFVSYLRRSFRCGGFAGWDGSPHVPRELVSLGSSLLPL